MPTPSPEPDIDRLSALYSHGVLDAEPDAFLAAVVQKIAAAFGGMTLKIVFVDDHRLWTAASAGPMPDETARAGTLASAAIEQMAPLVAADLRDDLEFGASVSVTGAPGVRAYAAVALRTADNFALGVLAVADTTPRSFRPEHIALLERGAARIMDHLAARRAATLDSATGAMSQQAFRGQVAALSALAVRHRRDLSLLAVDLRAVRALVRRGGSDAAPLAPDRIRQFGRQSVRRLDAFGKLDDQLYAVLLPDTSEEGARRFGARVLETLARERGVSVPGPDPSFPAGLGVSALRPGLDGPDDLVARAIRDCRRAWPMAADPGDLRIA